MLKAALVRSGDRLGLQHRNLFGARKSPQRKDRVAARNRLTKACGASLLSVEEDLEHLRVVYSRSHANARAKLRRRWSQIHARTSATKSARPRSVMTVGRPPGSRSAAACRALGDNVLSAPRKRECTVVCRVLSHLAPPCIVAPAAWLLSPPVLPTPAVPCFLPPHLPLFPSCADAAHLVLPSRAPRVSSFARPAPAPPTLGAPGGAVPRRPCWRRPLSTPSPSGRPPPPLCSLVAAPCPPHLPMHPSRPQFSSLPLGPPPPCTQVGFGAVFRPPLREPSLTLSLPHRLQAPSSRAQLRPHHGGGADIAVCPASTTARPSHAPRPTAHGPRPTPHAPRPTAHGAKPTHCPETTAGQLNTPCAEPTGDHLVRRPRAWRRARGGGVRAVAGAALRHTCTAGESGGAV